MTDPTWPLESTCSPLEVARLVTEGPADVIAAEGTIWGQPFRFDERDREYHITVRARLMPLRRIYEELGHTAEDPTAASMLHLLAGQLDGVRAAMARWRLPEPSLPEVAIERLDAASIGWLPASPSDTCPHCGLAMLAHRAVKVGNGELHLRRICGPRPFAHTYVRV